jgi:peroxiredoxin
LSVTISEQEKKMFAKSLMLLFAVAFCVLLFCEGARADAEIGKPAPPLVAKTLDGKDFDLSSLNGKVVVVHFWATWCPACREEMPALEAVWRHEHSKGMEVLAISADRPRARADVDQVMKYFTFPAALLSAVSKNDFGTVTAIPVTYIIGKDGSVADIISPDAQILSAQNLDDEVNKLLAAKTEPKMDLKPESKPEVKP